MKKNIFLPFFLLLMSSCSTIYRTAHTEPVSTTITSGVVADLKVSNTKISYTYTPSSAVRKGGYKNIKSTAIAEALRLNGGGDVLVETQAEIIETKGWFGRSIKRITVTGYPATYENFRQKKYEE